MKQKPYSYWREQLSIYMQSNINVAREPVRREGGVSVPYLYEYANAADLYLRHGKFYPPQKSHPAYRNRERGHCYLNALTLAEENPRELRYCEGFATIGYVPVEHAFNIDRRGRVVDVTWAFGDPNEPDNPKAYCGIIIPTKQVRALCDGRAFYGLVVDDWVRGYPLLQRPFSMRRLREVVDELYAEGGDE